MILLFITVLLLLGSEPQDAILLYFSVETASDFHIVIYSVCYLMSVIHSPNLMLLFVCLRRGVCLNIYFWIFMFILFHPFPLYVVFHSGVY
jgi:hypothetical protein